MTNPSDLSAFSVNGVFFTVHLTRTPTKKFEKITGLSELSGD